MHSPQIVLKKMYYVHHPIHWLKLEVDLTQDGSPQLQDLGQYHLPHFPLYRLQPLVVYTKYINAHQMFNSPI